MALRTINNLELVEFNDEKVWIEIYPNVAQGALGASVTTIQWWKDFFQKINDTGLVSGISVRVSEIDRLSDQSNKSYPVDGSFTDNDGTASRLYRCLVALADFPFQKIWTRKMWLFSGSAASNSITAQFGDLPLTNYFYNADWWYYIRNIARDEANNFGFDTYMIDTEPYATFKDEIEFGSSNEYTYGSTNWNTQESEEYVFDKYPITENGTVYNRNAHISGLNGIISDLRSLTGTDTPFPRSWSTSTDPSSTNLPKFWSQLDELTINQKTFYYPNSASTWFALTRRTNTSDVQAVLVRDEPFVGQVSGITNDRPHRIYEAFEHTYKQFQTPSELYLEEIGISDATIATNLNSLTDPSTGWVGDNVAFANFKEDISQIATGINTAEIDRKFWHRFWGKDDKLVDGGGYRGELIIYVDGTTASQAELHLLADDLLAYATTLNQMFPPTGTNYRRTRNSDRLLLYTGKYRCVGPCSETHWEIQLLDRVYGTVIKTLSLKTTSTNIDDDITSGDARDVDDGIEIYFADNRNTIIDINTEGLLVQFRSRNKSVQTNRAGDESWSVWSGWKDILMSSKNIYVGIG